MAVSAEILVTGEESTIGTATLKAALIGAHKAGLNAVVTKRYQGKSDWLVIFGAGAAYRNSVRIQHVAAYKHVACWDLAYLGPGKDPARSYVRVSIDHNHPHRLMNKTPNEPSRFAAHGIELREDADPDGPIIVIGMGMKSRVHLSLRDWEINTLRKMRRRFPDKTVIYRPKPQGHRDPHIDWEPRDGMSPIEDLLKGASLVVCRHSNVAVDACIAGVPVETEDGAAYALYSNTRNPTREQRLDFLRRLSWWQWRLAEMEEAWKFLVAVSS